MTKLVLSELNIYPIKSLGGISLMSSEVEERGLKYDRRWLLVDENGIFMTQRDFPQMALIKLTLSETHLKAMPKNDKSLSPVLIPLQNKRDEKISVTIWNDQCNVLLAGKEYDDWFSDAVKSKCRLVYMPDDERRIVEKKFITEDKIVSFADAYPFLIIGQSSLDKLNSRLDVKLPMNRFRTNFVFTGGVPFEEDTWKDFAIGTVGFKAVKPCARCVITTTDQDTAERKNEPLKTLSTYRKFGNKVMFGMNLIACVDGIVSVGDKIELL